MRLRYLLLGVLCVVAVGHAGLCGPLAAASAVVAEPDRSGALPDTWPTTGHQISAECSDVAPILLASTKKASLLSLRGERKLPPESEFQEERYGTSISLSDGGSCEFQVWKGNEPQIACRVDQSGSEDAAELLFRRLVSCVREAHGDVEIDPFGLDLLHVTAGWLAVDVTEDTEPSPAIRVTFRIP